MEEDLDNQPQGGPDVRSWRTPDGIGHRFDDDTYAGSGCELSPSEWRAICDAPLECAAPDLEDPVDCMACIARGWL